jgi:hypothetical protein
VPALIKSSSSTTIVAKIMGIFFPDGIIALRYEEAFRKVRDLDELFKKEPAVLLQPRQQRRYWRAGSYRASIERISFRYSEAYIIEFKILSSTNSAINVGDEVGHVIKLNRELAIGEIASFVRVCKATALGIRHKPIADPENLTLHERDVEDSYGNDQPFAGFEIAVECVDVVTKAGSSLTKVTYKTLDSYLKKPSAPAKGRKAR